MTAGDGRDYVFGLDIGTRNVVGSVGYLEDKDFHVVAQYSLEHESRAMLDGQIHDIGRVSGTIGRVKEALEAQVGFPLTEVCIAAAGRVLRTVTTRVEMVFPEERVVSREDLNTLDLMGVDQAQRDILMNNERYKFYCVGYTVMKYYLNGERFSSIEGHKAERIEEVIIVTFLPEDVVDGLYSAVERCGLTVANLTLEPIAAINIAIPENFRMLNIALVDVGAGTSDICITKDGSIIAYGMIPSAGDELTEVIVQAYLVDFAMAERIKKESAELEEISYEDIMGITHKVKATDVWKLTDPIMEKITTDVAAQIKFLNGDETVAATFIVGGGGKIHGFCESLAKKLELIEERVALRGEEVMKSVYFEQPEIKKDPLLVTPIGICLNYYEQKNSFIMIRLNGEFMKLYDNGHLKVVDAALQAGFSTEELFPQRGQELHFTVNGTERMVRGTQGESATVRMNGNIVGLNDRLEPNSQLTVEHSTVGEEASLRIEQLDEYANSYVIFIVNGQRIKCPKFVEVNGHLEPGTYVIQEQDVIETRSFYTVGQLAAFMDVEVDPNHEIIVNNLSADMDTLIYENFSIEWTVTGYGLKDGDYRPEGIEESEETGTSADSLPAIGQNDAEEDEPGGGGVSGRPGFLAAPNSMGAQLLPPEEEIDWDDEADVASRIGKIPPGMGKTLTDEEDSVSKYIGVGYNNTFPSNEFNKPLRPLTPLTQELEIPAQTLSINVRANGQEITLTGKKEYIFADIFTGIEFDVNAGGGRQVETTRNGEHCVYTTPVFEGDTLDIFWKDE